MVDVGSPEAVAEAGGRGVDTVLISHGHVDHLAGLNLLKWSSIRIEAYCSRGTLNSYYVWPSAFRNYEAVRFNIVEAFKPFKHGVAVTPLRLNHSIPALGFLIENALACLIDTVDLLEESLKLLKDAGVQVMLIDATYGLKEEFLTITTLS